MKRIIVLCIAIVAMANTQVNAKSSVSRTPVGCWSLTNESEPQTYSREDGVQDTLLTFYRTDFDSLLLCPKGVGLLEYRVHKWYVYTTEDGYEKVKETVSEHSVRFKWKYKSGDVQILSYYPNVSCTYVERTFDNRENKYPSHFNNNQDEEAVQYMIDLLPQLELEYNPKNGRLYSHGYKAHFRHCKGKPTYYLCSQNMPILFGQWLYWQNEQSEYLRVAEYTDTPDECEENDMFYFSPDKLLWKYSRIDKDGDLVALRDEPALRLFLDGANSRIE